MKKVLLMLFVAAFATLSVSAQQGIQPSKKYQKQRVEDPGAYSNILIGSNIDVEFRQSRDAKSHIEIRLPDNLIEHLEVKVNFDTLRLNFKSDIKIDGKYKSKVVIYHSTLKSLVVSGGGEAKLKGKLNVQDLLIVAMNDSEITGSSINTTRFEARVHGEGEISIKGLDCNDITAIVDGKGEIDLRGKGTNATYVVNGEGDIDASKWVGMKVQADVSGSGKIKCNSTSKLISNVNGKGKIIYYGSPSSLELTGEKDNIRRK